MTEAQIPAIAPASRPDSLVPVAGLGVTQIVSYGSLYYAFAVLEPSISAEFGWSSAWSFGCFSVALLVGGLAGPLAGRFIDRRGARLALAVGSVASAASLAALSQSQGLCGFMLALVAVEIASTLTQYDAAFAAIAQTRDAREARSAITQVTIFGGFASTVFWPLTHWLTASLTWREIYLIFGALHLALCLPIHLLWLGGARPVQVPGAPGGPAAHEAGTLAPEQRLRGMVLVVMTFCLTGFVFSALNVHWVAALSELGLSAGVAVAAGALMGPAQVGVRLLDLMFGRRMDPLVTASVAIVFLLAATAVVLAAGTSYAGAAAFAVLFGLSQGLTSIVRGVVPLALFGRSGYGARLGTITAIRLVVTSGAPFAFALVIASLGPAFAFTSLAGLALLAFGALAAIPRPTPQTT
ncbi:MFS transporter [Microvirga roseola]|uniref:MFS transporter n=1 Tax=Microvirga roseola TaxID=2883126 RepID=UPI001E53A578|nr:MFS transporter [Microvirga roseola]